VSLSFQPVELDTDGYDSEAMLVFRDGRLLAIVCCLGEIHEAEEGKWFVEKGFGRLDGRPAGTFGTLDDFKSWALGEIERLTAIPLLR
jgi:hypothetical protein